MWLVGTAAAAGLGHHYGKKHEQKKEAERYANEQLYMHGYSPAPRTATAPLLSPLTLRGWRFVTDLPHHFCAELRTVDGNFLNINWQLEMPVPGQYRDLWEFTFVTGNMVTVMHVPSCRYLSAEHGKARCTSKHIHSDSVWTIQTVPSSESEQLFVLEDKHGVPLLAAGSPMLRFGLPGY